VNVTGLKYKNFTEEKINNEINFFINDFINASKLGLVQKITELLVLYKSNILNNYSPVSLLKKLKDDLINIPSQLNDNEQALQDNNIFENMFKVYM